MTKIYKYLEMGHYFGDTAEDALEYLINDAGLDPANHGCDVDDFIETSKFQILVDANFEKYLGYINSDSRDEKIAFVVHMSMRFPFVPLSKSEATRVVDFFEADYDNRADRRVAYEKLI